MKMKPEDIKALRTEEREYATQDFAEAMGAMEMNMPLPDDDSEEYLFGQVVEKFESAVEAIDILQGTELPSNDARDDLVALALAVKNLYTKLKTKVKP